MSDSAFEAYLVKWHHKFMMEHNFENQFVDRIINVVPNWCQINFFILERLNDEAIQISALKAEPIEQNIFPTYGRLNVVLLRSEGIASTGNHYDLLLPTPKTTNKSK